MLDFVLPFRPEELLARPAAEDQLWASSIPDVDVWSQAETDSALDDLVGKLLPTHGAAIASEESFNLIFGLLHAWPRLSSITRSRTADLLLDAARRVFAAAEKLKRKKGDNEAKEKDMRTIAKVLTFDLRWAAERVISKDGVVDEAGPGKGRGRGGKGRGGEDDDRQRVAADRQRTALFEALANIVAGEQLSWLWEAAGATESQRVAEHISGAGLHALDEPEIALKNKETRQQILRCVTEPLVKGEVSTNLFMSTCDKLALSLRGGELVAPFVAEVFTLTHTTQLPRLLIVEISNMCTAKGIGTQPTLQRAVADFLRAAGEKLPHIFLSQLSMLLPLLDVEAYPLRMGVLECFGSIVASEGRPLLQGKAKDEKESDAGDGAGPSNKFALDAATKNKLLDTLTARCMDKTSWVRARALQVLASLVSRRGVSGPCMPRERWPEILELAAARLRDCANGPRRAGLQLVRSLIERHPYGPNLSGTGDERARAEAVIKEVEANLEQLEKDMQEPLPKKRRLTKKTVREDENEDAVMDGEDEIADFIEEDDENNSGIKDEREKKRQKLILMRECFKQRLRFVDILSQAAHQFRALLHSNTPSDATEAINVVVELQVRGLPFVGQALMGEVFSLVWSRHASVKEAAVNSFHRAFLEDRSAQEAAQNLLDMYRRGIEGREWTHSHLASIQELILQAAKQDLLEPAPLFPELIASLDGPLGCHALRALTALSAADSKPLVAALPRLCTLCDGTSVHKKQRRLSKKSLVPNAQPENQVRTVQEAEQELERLRLLSDLLKLGLENPEMRCKECWDVAMRCADVLVGYFSLDCLPVEWFNSAQAIVDLTFAFASYTEPGKLPEPAAMFSPDQFWEQVLVRMVCNLNREAETAEPPVDEELLLAVPQVSKDAFSPEQIGCIVFLAGHLSLQMLVYLEGLHAALKRKRAAQEDARMSKGDGEEEKDMGMAGQEEREAEAFAEIAERALLYAPQSLLTKIKPLILGSLLDARLRRSTVLRRVGALGLCKMMVVSRRFCEEHLQLLFSLLFPSNKAKGLHLESSMTEADTHEQSAMSIVYEDKCLRQCLLVSVGDLLYRHPNLVEPWSDRLYAALNSSSTTVKSEVELELRFTALMVLTHLVLNDMMKPRAALLARALRLTSVEHPATARIAKVLFQELAKKGSNAVFNIAPELIARLSHGEGAPAGETQEDDEKHIAYLLQFVEKEKHTEQLIERFSVRIAQSAELSNAADLLGQASQLPGTQQEDMTMPNRDKDTTARTIRCLSVALASLTYSDRCVLRLLDVIVTRRVLQQAIPYHESLRENLLNIVAKARLAMQQKKGRGKEDTSAPAEGAVAEALVADSKDGSKAGAVLAALDNIEQVVAEWHRKNQPDAAPEENAAMEDKAPLGEAQATSDAPKADKEKKPTRSRKNGVAEKENQEAKGDQEAAKENQDEQNQQNKPEKKAKGKGKGRKPKAKADEDEDFVPGAKTSSKKAQRGVARSRAAQSVDDDSGSE
eukprot:gnl/MRDRNA2_/MRDRNA2_93593_c0_seq1.p1 gnl/MRDRNA2_/MRDRNA2_93593_c0~~gnl/MRDRNA2_/MRDRNA2_93593_c0_seq1.p1  ORF type:complete len:1501 (-),score=365.61 gnl/MRDRNA2_/MRDRNA2_93593_c0_seq1:76-4578(-)